MDPKINCYNLTKTSRFAEILDMQTLEHINNKMLSRDAKNSATYEPVDPQLANTITSSQV